MIQSFSLVGVEVWVKWGCGRRENILSQRRCKSSTTNISEFEDLLFSGREDKSSFRTLYPRVALLLTVLTPNAAATLTRLHY